MGKNSLLLFINTKGSDIYINHSPLNNNSISIFYVFTVLFILNFWILFMIDKLNVKKFVVKSVQMFSHKMNKFWGFNVQFDD